jgi:hypothetical protein
MHLLRSAALNTLMLPHTEIMHAAAAVLQQICSQGLMFLAIRHVQCNVWLTVYRLMQIARSC